MEILAIHVKAQGDPVAFSLEPGEGAAVARGKPPFAGEPKGVNDEAVFYRLVSHGTSKGHFVSGWGAKSGFGGGWASIAGSECVHYTQETPGGAPGKLWESRGFAGYSSLGPGSRCFCA